MIGRLWLAWVQETFRRQLNLLRDEGWPNDFL